MTMPVRVLRFCAATLVALSLPLGAAAQTADDLFNSANLNDIKLALNSADWAKLKENFRDNTYYPADLTWGDLKVRNVGIRSRGNGSRSGVKPGLRVDFDRYASGQRFLDLKSLVLDNLVQDPSTMKEVISMSLFSRLSLPAPREAFVRLYVNNTLVGLYAVVESIDKSFLKRVLGQNDGNLYEYNYLYPYNFEYLGADFAPYQELFDPKTNESHSTFDLFDAIERMVRTANEASDGAFESAISAFLDLPALARHLAAENYTAENDGILGYAGMNNFYLYELEDSTQFRVITWDKDNTFLQSDFPILQRTDQNVLVRRALAIPSFKQAYFDGLVAAADSAVDGQADGDAGTGWMAQEVERLYALVHAAVLADVNKPYSNDDFEAAVDGIRTFARQRSAYVKCEVAAQSGTPGGCTP